MKANGGSPLTVAVFSPSINGCSTRFKGRSGQSKEGLGTVLPGPRLGPPETRPSAFGTTRARYRADDPPGSRFLSMFHPCKWTIPGLRAGAVVCSLVGDGSRPVQLWCQDTPGRRFSRSSGGRQGHEALARCGATCYVSDGGCARLTPGIMTCNCEPEPHLSKTARCIPARGS